MIGLYLNCFCGWKIELVIYTTKLFSLIPYLKLFYNFFYTRIKLLTNLKLVDPN